MNVFRAQHKHETHQFSCSRPQIYWILSFFNDVSDKFALYLNVTFDWPTSAFHPTSAHSRNSTNVVTGLSSRIINCTLSMPLEFMRRQVFSDSPKALKMHCIHWVLYTSVRSSRQIYSSKLSQSEGNEIAQLPWSPLDDNCMWGELGDIINSREFPHHSSSDMASFKGADWIITRFITGLSAHKKSVGPQVSIV